MSTQTLTLATTFQSVELLPESLSSTQSSSPVIELDQPLPKSTPAASKLPNQDLAV